jgi:hypothetical protein
MNQVVPPPVGEGSGLGEGSILCVNPWNADGVVVPTARAKIGGRADPEVHTSIPWLLPFDDEEPAALSGPEPER